MEHYATILNGPETLAADILTNTTRDRFVVRYIDQETRRDAGIPAIFGTYYTHQIDDAMRHANAWVTQTPVS
jgi:hypothetical protein